MPVYQGLASFPGIKQVVSAEMTFSHGITPSVITVHIVPQVNLPQLIGNFIFAFGPTVIILRDCKINRASVQTNASGQIYSFSLWDRRWRWQYGEISGNYNIQLSQAMRQTLAQAIVDATGGDAPLDQAQIRSARELVILCLVAMGETVFDVSQVSDAIAPPVHWDRSNPAQAIQQIADQAGCRVVLRLNNTILIAKIGVGKPLPPGQILDGNKSFKISNRPDGIKLVCGPTRYQAYFNLEAVGPDTDGTIKPIDDLSYRPAGGWTNDQGPSWSQVSNTPDPFDNVIPRELAQSYIYKWYRITMEPIQEKIGGRRQLHPIVGFNERIDNINQILPLMDQLNERNTQDFREQYKKAFVYGKFFEMVHNGPQTVDPPMRLYDRKRYPWQFLTDFGIVEFSYMVYLGEFTNNRLTSHKPAELYLVCVANVMANRTLKLDRLEVPLALPGPRLGTGALIVQRDEIFLEVTPELDADTGKLTGKIETNLQWISPAISHYLAGVALEFQDTEGIDVTYPGLVAIDLDGAIQQVAWSVGGGGARTRASRNTEFSNVVPPYKQRRLYDEARQQIYDRQVRRARRERRLDAMNRHLP